MWSYHLFLYKPNHLALGHLPHFQSTDLQYPPPWAKIMFDLTAMPSIRHRLAKSNDTFFFIFSSFSSVSFYRRYLCLFTLYHIFPYLSTFIEIVILSSSSILHIPQYCSSLISQQTTCSIIKSLTSVLQQVQDFLKRSWCSIPLHRRWLLLRAGSYVPHRCCIRLWHQDSPTRRIHSFADRQCCNPW